MSFPSPTTAKEKKMQEIYQESADQSGFLKEKGQSD